MTPRLEVRDLQVQIAGRVVIDKCSFEIGNGESMAVVGANGAGKSVLLRSIAGLFLPARGSVHLDGLNVSRLVTWRRARRGILLVTEGRGVFERMTVAENLRVAHRREGKVGGDLPPYLPPGGSLLQRSDRDARTLSHAERTMLALARALSLGPRLLLVDEPFTGLDGHKRKLVAGWLTYAALAGTSILFAEQSKDRAWWVTPNHLELQRGRIKHSIG